MAANLLQMRPPPDPRRRFRHARSPGAARCCDARGDGGRSRTGNRASSWMAAQGQIEPSPRCERTSQLRREQTFTRPRLGFRTRPKAVARRFGLAVMSRIASFDLYDVHAYSEDDGNGREPWTPLKKRSSGVAARPEI